VDAVFPQFGVPSLSNDQRAVGWNSEAGARALRWYTDFVRRLKVNSVLLPEGRDAFRLGLSSMTVDGNWQVDYLRRSAPNLELGTAPLPQPAHGPRATYGTFWATAVSASTSDTERRAAFAFLAFLGRYDTMTAWCDATGELPVRRRLLKDKALQARHPLLTPFMRQMAFARASLKKDEGTYKAAMVDAIDEVLLRDTPPRLAIQQAAARVNAMLRRR